MSCQYWKEKDKRNMQNVEEGGNPRLSKMTPSPTTLLYISPF